MGGSRTNNSIESVDLTRLLPPSLKYDPKLQALAEIIAGELQNTNRMIHNNIIYARIDELDEQILDILAYDLHVDWYDDRDDLSVKRKNIKDSVKVHRRLGTKYAVETVLGNAFPGAKVQEWYEYGGNPYLFRVLGTLSQQGGVSDLFQEHPAPGAGLAALLKRMNFYKNLRSHLESIVVELQLDGAARVGHMLSEVNRTNIWPRLPTHLTGESTLRLGLYQSSAQAVVVRPKLPSSIQWESRWGIAHQLNSVQTVTVGPYQSFGIRRETSWSPAYRLHSVQAVTVGPLVYRPMQLAGSSRMGMLSSTIQATKIRAKGET